MFTPQQPQNPDLWPQSGAGSTCRVAPRTLFSCDFREKWLKRLFFPHPGGLPSAELRKLGAGIRQTPSFDYLAPTKFRPCFSCCPNRARFSKESLGGCSEPWGGLKYPKSPRFAQEHDEEAPVTPRRVPKAAREGTSRRDHEDNFR